uniref:Uncharacterized protein n=1 Tax=Mola mola TaxID=94237 RepID=A0A3Q3WUY8_MOLML
VLGLEVCMGVFGNALVLLLCSLLIITGSLFNILTGGQRSAWCEVVSLLKFAIGSINLCGKRLIGPASTGSPYFVVMVNECLASWVTGVMDPAEMLCAVFWGNSYSDMLVYILCVSSICILLPCLLTLLRTSLLVASYMLCLILLGRIDMAPSPDWLRTLSSVTSSYLDCSLNPLTYRSHQDFQETGLALLWTSRKPSLEPVLT